MQHVEDDILKNATRLQVPLKREVLFPAGG
jgi:hypothetical protein